MNPDLSTNYLGLELSSPIVASCSPLTGRLDTLAELESAGAGAVVLPSLFEEEVEAEELVAADLLAVGEDQAEFASAPLDIELDLDRIGAGRTYNLLKEAKKNLNIPVIASVNGYRKGGWARYAKQLADSGADAIELNLYAVNYDPEQSSAQIEDEYLQIISEVVQSVDVAVAVKLSQHFTGFGNFAKRAVEAGAAGMVLFNRFYGAEIDLDQMQVVSKRRLSNPDELRFPIRWIAILRSRYPELSLAATSGVHSGLDVLKAVAAGADVACTTSAVLTDGAAAIDQMLTEATTWLKEHDYASIAQLRSSMSTENVADAAAFEREHYMDVVHKHMI